MLWIPKPIYQSMIIDTEKWKPCETGGVFMGYRAENQDSVVTDMIYAGPCAIHSRFRFNPDQDYQLKQIADIYLASKGTITYLGDWHSHPNSKPELSLLDRRTLTKIAITTESMNKNPIMVILGRYPKQWTLNAVYFVSGKLLLWPFVECEYMKLPFVIFE